MRTPYGKSDTLRVHVNNPPLILFDIDRSIP